MSKNIVSGAVALMLVVMPLSASALTEVAIPAIPKNASIEQLLAYVNVLTTLLQKLIAEKNQTKPATDPISCPVYNIPICAAGNHVVAGPIASNGCQSAPSCVPDATQPISCPVYNIPICAVGSHVVAGPISSNGCQAAPTCVPDSTSTTGSVTISTDASTPGYQIVSGGATGVTLSAFKVRAAGEAVRITRFELTLSSDTASPNDLTGFTLWNNGVQIGSGVFAGQNTATVSLSQALTVQKDTDTVIVVKGNISNIGIAQVGKSGDLIRLLMTGAVGAGATTGTNVERHQLDSTPSTVAGVRIFKSFPTFTSIPAPSSSGIVNGNNVLLRFSVTASPSGDVQLGRLRSYIAATYANITDASLSVYSDAGFSQPLASRGGQSVIATQTFSPVTQSNSFTTNAGVVPAGQTLYYEVRGTLAVIPGGAVSVVTSLKGDTQASVGTLVKVEDQSNSLTWSGNGLNATANDVDWSNGFGISGLANVTQTRTGTAGTTPPPSSPRVEFVSVSAIDVTAKYIDMPANTQIVLVNKTTGARVESISTFVGVPGSDGFKMTLTGVAAGTYYLKAQNYSTGAYIAQSVAFTYAGSVTTNTPPNPITTACPSAFLVNGTCKLSHVFGKHSTSGLNATFFSFVRPGLVYAVNFGDGTEVQIPSCPGTCSDAAYFTHVYTAPGTYTATVIDYSCPSGSTSCNRIIDSASVAVGGQTALNGGTSNISNIAFSGDVSMGTVAGVSISLDQQMFDDNARAEISQTLGEIAVVLDSIIHALE